MEAEGDGWIGTPPVSPFWRAAGRAPPRKKRFRVCEEALRARRHQPKSIFQLVGNGQVGAGSVRGMPHLARLRAHGFAVWPFHAATDRTAIEIYPSLLGKIAPHHHSRAFANVHERDAEVSARVMWEHRESFAQLQAASDPVTLLEGDVWTPPGFWTA
jgi:hypothetical protein